MKICSSCGITYSDDTQKFCYQDGSPLHDVPEIESPTVVLDESETVVSPRRVPPLPARSGSDQSRVTQVSLPPAEPKKSNTLLAVVLTVLGMLVIFGVIGAGAWLYLRDKQGETGKNTGNSTRNNNLPARNTNAKTTPPAAPSPNTNSTTSPTPEVDTEEIRREVTKTIMTWKSAAESHDLDSYMGSYADTVDYYRKKGATRAFVRGDKQRAFDMFDSIDIDISNVNVSPGPTGDEATVEFDKEWVFEGARRSTGKVRQQLRLKNVDGEWLITAERDVKVYYTN